MNQFVASPAALLAFIRAAELGSFAAAGRTLDLSAPAVGQAVQRLEDGFGVKLLQRTTRRMTLTADGRLLLERCRGVVAELTEIERLFTESRGAVAGPLRISAPSGLARHVVMPIIARFVAAYPAVDLTLDCTDAIRDFARDPVDVAFRVLRPTDSAVIARRLARLTAVTVAAPAYLRQHGAPKHPEDLAARRWIAYRHPVSGVLAPLRFRIDGRETTMTPAQRLTVNDVEAGCEAAALGLGIAQPPEHFVAPLLAAGRLVRILDRYATAPWTLYLCYPSVKHLPRRVRAFVDFVRSQADRFSAQSEIDRGER